MDLDKLRADLKSSLEDIELHEDDRAFVMEEAKMVALLYHALLAYGIPPGVTENLARDYFNSRLGCDCEDENREGERAPNPWLPFSGLEYRTG